MAYIYINILEGRQRSPRPPSALLLCPFFLPSSPPSPSLLPNIERSRLYGQPPLAACQNPHFLSLLKHLSFEALLLHSSFASLLLHTIFFFPISSLLISPLCFLRFPGCWVVAYLAGSADSDSGSHFRRKDCIFMRVVLVG